ncbi:hypothetical protein PILCRDRAFT_93097 [Piloderma croceum F 1598]|uniref:Uncharacterized protein n=1 Tax=Piloderma croceum (strain F 1598) TaxID=765440 RepID=A0A0C3F041_PILCF|nr:hypothetical protein PILCRDRAFT_93097 [Piloderma croceum F 1598]
MDQHSHSDSNDLQALHRRFHSIITLTTLISSINNNPQGGAHPKLARLSHLLTPIGKDKPQVDPVLDSYANLVARNFEVAATCYYNLNKTKDIASTGIAIVVNPEEDDGYHFLDTPDTCILVPDGTSPYSHQKPWDHISWIDPLPSHIATLKQYLAEYEQKQKPNERARQFFDFGPYMVTQCWPKMHRRIIHQSSQGFILNLGQITEEDVKDRFAFFQSIAATLPKRNDSALGILLVGMARDDQIEPLIMTPCGCPELSLRLTHILAAFGEIVGPSAKESNRLARDVYNEDTCWEFHQLLLTTLLSYGKALILLGKINDILQPNPTHRRKGKRTSTTVNINDLMQRREEYTERVMLCGRVLWRLAYSGVLHRHLTSLSADLDAPKSNKAELAIYQTYTNFHCVPIPGIVVEGDGIDREAGGEGDGIDCRAEGVGGVGDELREIIDDADLADLMGMTCKKWIRQQVTHWASLETISANVSTALNYREVSLIAMKHPCISNKAEVEPWETTVTDILATDQSSMDTDIPSAAAVINAIKNRTTFPAGSKWSPWWPNAIFYVFENKPCATFGTTVHCEAILASLVKFIPESQTENVKALIQNIEKNTIIAVSKQCCPACWELLNILRHHGVEFHVRGHHTTVHPVELPQWLPRDVMEELVIAVLPFDPLQASSKHTDALHLLVMQQASGHSGPAPDGLESHDFRDMDKRNRLDSTTRDEPGLDGDHPRVLVADNGASHLAHINLWSYNLNLRKDPLNNHIATVEGYLTEYKSLQTSKKDIITEGRLQSWFNLARNDIATRLPKQNNSALGILLVGMAQDDQIKPLIMAPCGRPELSSGLTHILATFREIVGPSAKESARLARDVYNEDTCWEFHQLLLATLLSYGKALVLLGKINDILQLNPTHRQKGKRTLTTTNINDLMQRREEYTEHVMLCGIVLWRLAYSGMLRRHLAVLRRGVILSAPMIDMGQLARYQLYTGFSHICVSPTDDCVMEGMDDDDDGCVGGDEDEEFQHIKDEAEESIELLYHKWLHLQASHWAVLDTVSVSARLSAPCGLKVSLIAVDHPNNKLRVEPWKTTVRDMLASGSPLSSTDTDILNAEAVIDTINRHVQLCMEEKARWLNPIFRAFENDPDGRTGSLILLHEIMVMMRQQRQVEYDFSLLMQDDSNAIRASACLL